MRYLLVRLAQAGAQRCTGVARIRLRLTDEPGLDTEPHRCGRRLTCSPLTRLNGCAASAGPPLRQALNRFWSNAARRTQSLVKCGDGLMPVDAAEGDRLFGNHHNVGEGPPASGAAYGWGWLVELLEDYGFDPHLVHPLRCKAAVR